MLAGMATPWPLTTREAVVTGGIAPCQRPTMYVLLYGIAVSLPYKGRRWLP